MSTEHKDIVDAQLHEPKGANTAQEGHVYISDGAGSGAWEPPELEGQAAANEGAIAVSNGAGAITWKYFPEGWGYYKDNGSTNVFNTTAAKLLIDGSGSTSDSDYLPHEIRGSGELWDVTTNKITPMTLGDSYQMRVDLPVTAKTGSPGSVTLTLDIGGGATPTVLILTKELVTTKTPPYVMSTSTGFFTKSTFLTNGGQIFLTTDAGTLTVTNPAVYIKRTSAGDL